MVYQWPWCASRGLWDCLRLVGCWVVGLLSFVCWLAAMIDDWRLRDAMARPSAIYLAGLFMSLDDRGLVTSQHPATSHHTQLDKHPTTNEEDKVAQTGNLPTTINTKKARPLLHHNNRY
eukprot:scaffold15942_cov78-Cyclotella_meneghiniana.AAC.3